tara:strand:+ start:7943 stop:8917 length:975 start_codon:yes stop_codon:yes gene_type:complete
MAKLRVRTIPESQEWEMEEFQGNQRELEYSENCCAMAKEVWERTVLDRLNMHQDMRAQNHADKLSVKHLDCEAFLQLLEKLQAITHTGNTNIVGAINSLATRYIPKLNQMPTTLLQAAADAVKTAGVQAYSAWRNCTEQERKQRPATSEVSRDFFNQLMSNDRGNQMNWFNILKTDNLRRRQSIADIEMDFGQIIERAIQVWLAKESDEMTGHEAQVSDIGSEPILIHKAGKIGVWVDAEDDYYLQIYMTDYVKNDDGTYGVTSDDELIPIGTFQWDAKQLNLDDRLLEKISSKALRLLVPTYRQTYERTTKPPTKFGRKRRGP